MAKIHVPTVPHSWRSTEWPSTIYPCSASRAKYILRAHRDELVAAGALTRIGRDLVVLGAAYSSWLQRQSGRVSEFKPMTPRRA
jgi:hypothetical protein